MATKVLATVVCLLAITQVQSVELNSDGKIKISVYMTAGCSDTVRFVRDQLAEAYRLYGEFLDIEFISWGKTTWEQEEGAEIDCQFGENDCWANHLQRCVVSLLKDNQAALVNYMICEFTTPFPSFSIGSYQCAQSVGLNLVELDFCVANNHDALAREAQAASEEAIAAFYFVPTVVFNDNIVREEHDQAQTRLASFICFALAAHPETGIASCQI